MSISRTALVTGAGSGIGAAIAQGLAADGHRVIVTDLDLTAAEQTVTEIAADGGMATAEVLDVADPGMVRLEIERVGPLAVLVNNAGLQHVAPLDTYPLEMWNRLMAVLLTGPFLTAQAALPGMRAQKWGRIINIASINGKRGDPGKAAYCAAKHGVIGLTRTAALEAAADGITVNAICPGFVDTPLTRGQLADLGALHGIPPDEVIQRFFLPRMPTGRPVEREEVAGLVRYLASDAAASITGQAINIDGGTVMV